MSTIRQSPKDEDCDYIMDDLNEWTWIKVAGSVDLLIRQNEDGALVVEAFRKGHELDTHAQLLAKDTPPAS